MLTQFTELLEEKYSIPTEQSLAIFQRTGVMIAAFIFAISCTVIVGFEDIFTNFNSVANLEMGSVPSEDVIARQGGTYTSNILTEQERENARMQVFPVFDPPDPNVARQQTQLTQQILEFIDNVRSDSFASLEQQIADIKQITALTLDDETIRSMLQLTDDSWLTVRGETVSVLERVMRQSIRDTELQNIRDQLPTQVSIRLTQLESQIVTAMITDIVRANTFENPIKTQAAQDDAANAVQDQQRQFIVGQTIAPANEIVDNVTFEALQQLGLLTETSNRSLRVLRAFVASALVMVLAGLYINRFESQLFESDKDTMILIAVIFLLGLIFVRAFGLDANIYLFPAATLGILYVATTSANLAIIGTLGFAFLASLMGRGSLEIATLFTAGNITAILTLRDAGRLNNYFIAGAIVGITNTAVTAIFTVLIAGDTTNISNLLAAFFSGIVIVPTTSFAAMYALTIIFNLPTAFKLIDLAQPSKPLLQRLLREAPGTYQHSLQVANLAEQAAEAIGADAQITHVGALYHDIGKMANTVFFTENQQHIDNPHDSLNDPYRSADIIISHATEGDIIAKKYNLPSRIREFIREHHGTTQVFVFYQKAIERAGSEEAVDIEDFTYPGPIPQSRETAILMMADSCESAIRAIKPQSNKEIAEVVHRIIEGKRNGGQLNASQLTLNELQKIEDTFVDIFKGLFHPRIDYEKAVQPKTSPIKRDTTQSVSETTAETKPKKSTLTSERAAVNDSRPAFMTQETPTLPKDPAPSPSKSNAETPKSMPFVLTDTGTIPPITGDNEPLSEVPPLPKRNGNRSTQEMKKAGEATDAEDTE